MPLTIRRTPRTAQGYKEPLLDVGDALPLHMVQIPGGTFLMGSPEDEPERLTSEGPQHSVTVPSFFMGRYPITQAQYEKVMGNNPATKYDAKRFVAPNKPVVGVSWYDAIEFCDRLSQHTHRPYRLPTEAEWEYACRAGTQTPFYFGKTITTELANYNGNYTYDNGPQGEYREETTPVDHFGVANAFGLCDMHGNVWEWCQDDWHGNYNEDPEDGKPPVDGRAWLSSDERKTDNKNLAKILRGGSWGNFPRYCRSACRFRYAPDNAHRRHRVSRLLRAPEDSSVALYTFALLLSTENIKLVPPWREAPKNFLGFLEFCSLIISQNFPRTQALPPIGSILGSLVHRPPRF